MFVLATEIFLFAVSAALVLSVVRYSAKWLRLWPIILISLLIAHLIINGFYQSLVLVYLISSVLLIIGLYERISAKSLKNKHNILTSIWAILWRIEFAVVLIASTLFGLTFRKPDGLIKTLFMNSQSDYSRLSFSKAFLQMNHTLAENYALGDWEKINWNSLESQFIDKIKNAEAIENTVQYYLALREYVCSIEESGSAKLAGIDFWGELYRATVMKN